MRRDKQEVTEGTGEKQELNHGIHGSHGIEQGGNEHSEPSFYWRLSEIHQVNSVCCPSVDSVYSVVLHSSIQQAAGGDFKVADNRAGAFVDDDRFQLEVGAVGVGQLLAKLRLRHSL